MSEVHGFGYIKPEPKAPTKKIKIPKVTTIDFETFEIEGRPTYPPVPVGVAIKKFGKKSRYYHWAHVNGTHNCTIDQAREALVEAYGNAEGILFHNGKFDLDVAAVYMGMPVPEWHRVHESMFLLYLDNPHARELGLKPAAKRLLGMEPEERDVVFDWLVEHQPVPGVRIKSAKAAGKYIAYAPGDVVSPYANGDCVRTEALFCHLYQSTHDRGMMDAYDRERRLVPLLLSMEQTGIRVDLSRLAADVKKYNSVLAQIDTWLRKRIGCGLEVNLGSGQQLVHALEEAGLCDVSLMGVTPKSGKVKTDKVALEAGISDKQLAAVLKYETQLGTCVGTFMEPWLAVAEKSGGFIYTNWNQTRGNGEGGTRTGRFSSNPNFQNIPKEFDTLFGNGKDLPKMPFPLPALPLCRGYIIPYEKNHVLIGRDYSQQEPRILAHFEDGELLAQYQANPWIDYHDNAKEHLERIFQRVFKRKPVKNINLGIIYGQGVPSLAVKNGESIEDTKTLRDAIYTLYPGLKQMNADMKMRARLNQAIRTWGGREYYCEPPMFVNGRMMTFDYKMVNALVQGSAADCTKEGLLRFYEYIKRQHNRGWKIILQVHDEIVVSVPIEDMVEAQEALRIAMESVEFDVQILSEGAYSFDNWSAMKAYDVKGKRVEIDLPKQRKIT